ncbi:hypothetical protein DRQ29_02475, partial [bacterium]
KLSQIKNYFIICKLFLSLFYLLYEQGIRVSSMIGESCVLWLETDYNLICILISELPADSILSSNKAPT